uniref:Cubilin-like n=1 Tax=Saccoglossus kowalevskii TaxID=10224 RepID=A0ABM0MU46_SACKO|nr:PREDICTED: cubilin-like [Saccoglossus kowalevskii]
MGRTEFKCSVSCGDGERNRIVTCQRLSDNEVVNDLFCAGTKPSQLETCTRPSCSEPKLDGIFLNSENMNSRQEKMLSSFDAENEKTNLLLTPTCDADCGGGTRSRSVTCQNSQTQYNVSDTECPLPKPSELEECNIDPCPGCDEVVTSEKIVSSPGYLAGLNYDNNIDCTVTALAPTGQCVRLTFLNLQIQPGSMQGVCDFDYLMITDMGNSALTDTMCGSESRTFSSVTGQVEILLHSDGSITNQGYHLYVTFIECPLYTFVPGDWQECNVECGGGMRTRLVQCQRISDGIEMPVSFCSGPQPAASEPCNTQPCPGCDASFTVGNQFIQSTNYPLSYPPNQDCVYTVSNTQGCISLQFLDFNLEAHPTCDNDYLMIQDLGDSALDRKLCGGNLPQIWTSTSGNDVAITFHSNDNIQDKGFYIYETFVPCPLYAWSLGAWSDCSLDCGGGSRTRTVQCQLISSGAVVMDNLCTGPKPFETEDCNTQPCPDCDESFTAGYQFIQSTNYPLSYPPNQDCVYTVSNTQGCISLQFLDFNLEAHPTCDNDYLMIQDLGDSALDRKLCGGNLPQIWTSTSGNDVAITFHSNDNIQDKGFYIYETFVPCPLYAWSLGAWSDCSLDCGGGSRTRTVECQLISSGAVVMDNLCTGQKPFESEDCNTQPCPGCDEVVLVGSQTIGSPNYGIGNYPPNQDCIYTITNNQACVRLLFLNFDLEPGTTVDVCDRDYLRIEDLDYPGLVETYCGDTTPPNWMSASGNVKLTFHSNNNNEHAGFSVFETFIACPVFDWVAGAWGDCDVTCGTGMRRRTVECLDVQSNEPAVNDSLCLNSRPDDAEICTEAPCAVDCDVSVTSSSTISSYNYPDDYVNNLDCVTTIYNADGCINFLFLNFDLESGTVNDVCDTDYVKIEDVSGGEEQFFCGTYSPLPSWQSSTGNVRLTLHTNDALTAGGYQIFAVFGDCPSYTWTTEAWSQCTADCGGGTQSRVVSCIDVVTQVVVQESSCTDAKPATSQVCNTQLCIQYCGRVITDSSTAELTSPNYDGVSLYDNNEDCMNTILSLQSQCIRIMFVSMDIQLGSTSSVCDNDYLELSDNSNPALTTRYCGTSLPPDWISTGSTVAVKFVTNSNNVARGYKINYQFVSCSVPQWVTGSWLTCSVSCGSGTQSRTVSCQNDAGCTATCGGGTEFYSVTCLDTQTGLTATSEALCTGTKPANSLTCNTDPCGGTTA